MIEALWYGMIASLSFIGFVSILIYWLLHVYSPCKDRKIIICLPVNLTGNEMYREIFGVYLRKAVFGSLSSDNIVILNNRSDVVSVCDICELNKVYSDFECLTYDELLVKLKQEEKNGSGIT